MQSAQKIPSSYPLGKFCIVSLIVAAYFTGAHAYVPFAKQTALAEFRGQLQAEYDSDNNAYSGAHLPPAFFRMAEIPPEDRVTISWVLPASGCSVRLRSS